MRLGRRSDRGRDGNYYERKKAIRTKHLKFFPQGCKILDVGCAEGTLMKYMAERGYSVFGVDNDQRQIQAAADANMPVSNEDAISFLRRHEDIRWDRLQSCHRTYPR